MTLSLDAINLWLHSKCIWLHSKCIYHVYKLYLSGVTRTGFELLNVCLNKTWETIQWSFVMGNMWFQHQKEDTIMQCQVMTLNLLQVIITMNHT